MLAIVHTFATQRFRALAHDVQDTHDAREREAGRPETPSFRAELLHFLGEVEVVFGLWAVTLAAAIALFYGWETAKHYINSTVNYTGAAVRRGDHGARLDAPDPRARRSGLAPGRVAGTRHACGLVAHAAHRGPAARLPRSPSPRP